VIIPYNGIEPRIAENVFIAPTAVLIGEVIVEEGVSIWFGAVIRADHGPITVGAGSSIQDNSVLHVYKHSPTILEPNVTVGHGAVLEGCHIGSGTVVGMNAVVLPGAEIGESVMIAAGSVVGEGAKIPPRTLIAGSPAKVKKELSGSALQWTGSAASDYHRLRSQYLAQRIDRQIPGDF
jgi:carbonic anhydrase/acetyltransferase-like protein (isoleucine patch superfamily)